jgi:hypothetical protein
LCFPQLETPSKIDALVLLIARSTPQGKILESTTYSGGHFCKIGDPFARFCRIHVLLLFLLNAHLIMSKSTGTIWHGQAKCFQLSLVPAWSQLRKV